MNIKEIVEGMTAPQVAQVIKDNFNEVDKEKANKTDLNKSISDLTSVVEANKTDLNKSISDLTSVVEANKTDLTEKIDNNKVEADAKLSELGSKVFNNFFIGEGSKFTSKRIDGLLPSHRYKIHFPKLWDVVGITGLADFHAIFEVATATNGEVTPILRTTILEELKSEYTFTLPSSFDYVTVGGRAVDGKAIDFTIDDITAPRNFTWIAGDVNVVSYPNIDSKTGIMTMDGIIVVDGIYYDVKGKTFSLKNNLITTTVKIVFNTANGEFHAEGGDYQLLSTEIVIGGCRLRYGTEWTTYDVLNFPFLFTVDGVLYNEIQLDNYELNVGYRHVGFSVSSGTAHSSLNDRIKCYIPYGSLFCINYVSSKNSVSVIHPIFRYDDGTSEQFDVTEKKYFVATKTIVEIGIYLTGQEISSYDILDVYVEYGKTLSLESHELFLKAEGSEVKYIQLKKGLGHSSTKDQFSVSIKKGDSFDIRMINISSDVEKFYVGVQFVGNDSTTIIPTALSMDKAHSIIAQDDILAVGIYIESSNYTKDGAVAAYLSRSNMFGDAITNNAFTGIYIEDSTNDVLLRYAARLKEIGRSENFIFFTDPHLVGSDNLNQFDELVFKKKVGILQKYYNSAPIDHIICGGDWLQDRDTQVYALYKLGLIDATMNKLFKGYLPMLGNHDTNYQGYVSDTNMDRGDLSQSQITNVMFRQFGSAYYSYTARLSRFIIIDTQIDWESDMNEYKWEQIEWLGNLLLQNESENIIVFTHIYYTFGENINALVQNVCDIAKAFNLRTNITLNGKIYNFGYAKGYIRCMIGGHSHYDNVTNNNGIPIVITTNFNNSEATFDICSADFDNGKLYMTRVGIGEDRIVSLYNSVNT